MPDIWSVLRRVYSFRRGLLDGLLDEGPRQGEARDSGITGAGLVRLYIYMYIIYIHIYMYMKILQ